MAKTQANKDTSLWSHKNDFPIEETSGTQHTLARLIVPRLRAFRSLDKYCYPAELGSVGAWDKAIDKMIRAFELNMEHLPTGDAQEWKEFQEGFNLFCKYYIYLRD